MSHRTLPVRPRTLRRGLTAIALGAILAAIILLLAPTMQALLQIAAMTILAGALVFVVVLASLRGVEWLLERRA